MLSLLEEKQFSHSNEKADEGEVMFIWVDTGRCCDIKKVGSRRRT